jgi:regulator of protease activity HflC (stomatin/prohibitin superfamily)
MYAVHDPITAMLILAQTTVRSKIGEMTLDETFKNREVLNAHVLNALEQAGQEWGIVCTRYEVKDIEPPKSIMQAMKAEAEAERKKRAVVLESEGYRQAAVNRAEGEKVAAVLASEASATSVVNQAQGDANAVRAAATAEAEKMLVLARAKAEATEAVALALTSERGEDAARFALAGQYVDAFGQLGGRSSTLVVPHDASNVGSLVAQALAAVDVVKKEHERGDAV